MIATYTKHSVLVVGLSESESGLAFDILTREGFRVVGPAARANMALALAAHSPPSLAVIGPDLTGRRGPGELADELMSTWGTPSLILTDELEAGALLDSLLADRVRAALSPDTTAA